MTLKYITAPLSGTWKVSWTLNEGISILQQRNSTANKYMEVLEKQLPKQMSLRLWYVGTLKPLATSHLFNLISYKDDQDRWNNQSFLPVVFIGVYSRIDRVGKARVLLEFHEQ